MAMSGAPFGQQYSQAGVQQMGATGVNAQQLQSKPGLSNNLPQFSAELKGAGSVPNMVGFSLYMIFFCFYCNLLLTCACWKRQHCFTRQRKQLCYWLWTELHPMWWKCCSCQTFKFLGISQSNCSHTASASQWKHKRGRHYVEAPNLPVRKKFDRSFIGMMKAHQKHRLVLM